MATMPIYVKNPSPGYIGPISIKVVHVCSIVVDSSPSLFVQMGFPDLFHGKYMGKCFND